MPCCIWAHSAIHSNQHKYWRDSLKLPRICSETLYQPEGFPRYCHELSEGAGIHLLHVGGPLGPSSLLSPARRTGGRCVGSAGPAPLHSSTIRSGGSSLVSPLQMESSQLIHCRELVAHHLSTLQSSLLPNPVYVYSPLQHTLVTCNRGAFRSQPSSVPGPGFSKDNGRPEGPLTGTAALYPRLPAAGGGKPASAKRKVEEMEVDDFYDGIKRLYNEDLAPEVVALESMGSVCGADVSRQEGSVSPCPPLQPVSVM